MIQESLERGIVRVKHCRHLSLISSFRGRYMMSYLDTKFNENQITSFRGVVTTSGWTWTD